MLCGFWLVTFLVSLSVSFVVCVGVVGGFGFFVVCVLGWFFGLGLGVFVGCVFLRGVA